MRTLLLLLVCLGWAAAETIPVAVAASTADAVRALGAAYAQAHGHDLRITAASSGTLARQIEQGAPVEVVILANARWMAHLAGAGLLAEETRRDLVANRLVLVGPTGAPPIAITAAVPLFEGRLAIGDPAHVPAGRYGAEALRSLGWWPALESRLAPARDVRAALRLVELAACDLGLVYATDARASDQVSVRAVIPVEHHSPIRYPAACLRDAGPAALAFCEWLSGPAAAAIWRDHGFSPLGEHGD